MTVDVDIDKLELCTGPCRVMMMELGGIMKTENTSHCWQVETRAEKYQLLVEEVEVEGGGKEYRREQEYTRFLDSGFKRQ